MDTRSGSSRASRPIPSLFHLYLDLAKQSVAAWVADRASTMGAALAFYCAFSLAPLLMIVIAIAAAVFGADAARGAIVEQLSDIVGPVAAEAIQELLKAAKEPATGLFATVVGLVTLLVGATTVLVELQDDLDYIWKAPPRSGSGVVTMLRARLFSLLIILAIGLVLMATLTLSNAFTAFGDRLSPYFPNTTLGALHAVNTLFSLAIVTVVFAVLYKWLPNVRIAWRDVWIGALATAVLFSVGRIAIGFYLGRSAVASAYGAAGTLVALLLWLYYSAQVFLLGAEFTAVHARQRTGERDKDT
ncbi:MAG TPA: YihY/virulence factor BrkB family protein [Casimicrobiaceae bacterium]|jgi:membrane protein